MCHYCVPTAMFDPRLRNKLSPVLQTSHRTPYLFGHDINFLLREGREAQDVGAPLLCLTKMKCLTDDPAPRQASVSLSTSKRS